jgi:hypothetical protein
LVDTIDNVIGEALISERAISGRQAISQHATKQSKQRMRRAYTIL